MVNIQICFRKHLYRRELLLPITKEVESDDNSAIRRVFKRSYSIVGFAGLNGMEDVGNGYAGYMVISVRRESLYGDLDV